MGQFGQDLRREREARGVALESISGVTKISGRHLLALEEEKFTALPGGVLNKGIVRGYARACGMDEDAWVGRYLSAYHGSGQIKDDDQSWMEFTGNVGKSRKGEDGEPQTRLRWAGVAVLLALLLLFGWYVATFVQARSAGLAPRIGPSHAVMTARMETHGHRGLPLRS
jgi:cytoskeleton protein RodZ